MPVNKSPLEKSAGKLISAVQKEWGEELELADAASEISERVMGRCHDLLKAAKNNNVCNVLNGKSMTCYLGEVWVSRHPSVKKYIEKIEEEIEASDSL